MLHRFPGEFVCRADSSLDFTAWLDRLGISAVYVDGELVPVKPGVFTESDTAPVGDIVHVISTTHSLSLARLPRTLRERHYRFATPRQYCRFLEVAGALGHALFFPRGHGLVLPHPELVLRIGLGDKPIIPAALILEPDGDCPRMQFLTLLHTQSVLDCSNHVLACPMGRPLVPSL